MTSLAEMRKELRDMRKETVKPVSRMKKGDIAGEIARMREKRETTPAPAAVPSAPPKKMKSSVESIKDAKAKEFPVAPEKTKEPKKAEPKSAPKKKAGPSKADLMKMISEMED
jgi:hypothetical protein